MSKNVFKQADVSALTVLMMKEKREYEGLSKTEILAKVNKVGFRPSSEALKKICKSVGIPFEGRKVSNRGLTTSKHVRRLAGIIKRLGDEVGYTFPENDATLLKDILGGKLIPEESE